MAPLDLGSSEPMGKHRKLEDLPIFKQMAAKEAADKALRSKPAPRAPLVVTSLVLVIHVVHCKHCGQEFRYPNRHLLASYAPPHHRVLGTHNGAILNVPLRTVIERNGNGPDWCEECWPGPCAPDVTGK